MAKRIIITTEQYEKIRSNRPRKIQITEAQYELIKKKIIECKGKII